MNAHRHINIYIYTHTYIYIYVYIYIYTHIHCIHKYITHIHTYIHYITYIHAFFPHESAPDESAMSNSGKSETPTYLAKRGHYLLPGVA